MDSAKLFLSDFIPEFEIKNSLRFRGASYLRRQVTTNSNTKRITFSTWFKRSKTGRESVLGSFSGYFMVQFFSTDGVGRDDEVYFGADTHDGGNNAFAASTRSERRDTSAWYHLVGVLDTSQSIEAERLRIYINGERQDLDGGSYLNMPTYNAPVFFLNKPQTYDFATGRPYHGYLAETHFVDGMALEPTAFGEFVGTEWVPKDPDINPYVSSYYKYLTTSAGGWLPGYGPENAFTSSGASTDTPDAIVTFAPATPVPVTASVSMALGQNSNTCTITWNGQTVPNTQPVNNLEELFTVTEDSEISIANPLVITPNAGQSIVVGQIWVDGVRLVEQQNYGENGFYLDYSDPNDIGADKSGNGNNWVPTGFETYQPIKYTFENTNPSNTVNGYPNSGAGSNAPFEDPSSYVYGTDGVLGTFRYTFESAVVAYSSVGFRIQGMPQWYGNNSYKLYYNGGNVVDLPFNSTSGDQTIATVTDVPFTPDQYPVTIEKIEMTNTGGYLGGFAGLVIDGNKLNIAQQGGLYDVMKDTPSQPYPTLNPANTIGGDDGIHYGNLWVQDANSAVSSAYTGTVALKDGKWYWEVTRETKDNGAYYGVVFGNTVINDGQEGLTTGVYIDQAGGLNIGSNYYDNYLPAIDAYQDVVNIALDATTGEIWFGKNGVFEGDPASGTDPAATMGNYYYGYYPWVRVIGNTAYEIASINFGQHDFYYEVPDGFAAPNIKELTGMDVTNATSHFRCITDQGLNILPSAINLTGGGLWWIKARGTDAAVNDHQLVDDIRNNVFEGTLAYKSSLCPSAGDQVPYITPSSDCVAWCWAAPSIIIENFAGSIGTFNETNQAGGFSIIVDSGITGVNTTETLGHGLAQAPEFMIYKQVTNLSAFSGNYYVYHKDLGESAFLMLNNNSAVTNGSGLWGNTAPTDTVITRDCSEGSSVMYAWHTVPGYSKFGSYTGYSKDDNSFVYTGFKPAFVMVKRIDVNSDWVINDNVRLGVNSLRSGIQPNLASAESGAGGNIDFYSNGFKIRNSFTDYNGTVVYAAFAESPITTSLAE